MSIVPNRDPRWRWELVLRGPDSLRDDLGHIGTWVGPRTGPDKRTHGQKEDYVFRRLLVAWCQVDALSWPVTVRADRTTDREPDFLFTLPGSNTLGVEVTEAGEESYQAWLTHIDRDVDTSDLDTQSVPLEASTKRTIDELANAISRKNAKFDAGSYRVPDHCDLVVYDNTAWGGFLDKPQIVNAVRQRNDLRGRFRQVHVVFESMVYVDLFGECGRVDLRRAYEIDYAAWIDDQVDKLSEEGKRAVDWANIAEELGDLGKSERRALASHLRNLLMHLLKWKFQPDLRTESWRQSVDNGRLEARELLTENPSFKADLDTVVRRQYATARRLAAGETQLPIETFPGDPPFENDEILDPDFWPGDEMA